MNNKLEKFLLTRKELFDLVWEKPVQKLAQEFQISDVGLKKICTRNNIPVPPRGYWAKKEYGKTLPKKPTLSSKDSWDQKIQINPNVRFGETKTTRKSILSNTEEIEITVSEELKEPHPLVEKTRKALEKSKKDELIISPRADSRILDIQICRNSVDRALRIMDALLKYFEKKGIDIQILTKPRIMSVMIENEEIKFQLKEKPDSTPHIATNYEITKAKNDFWFRIPEYDYSPSGKLTLSITNASYLGGIQQNWSDGKIQKLENCLGRFYLGLIEASRAIKEKRLEREKREKEWEEKQRIYEEQRRLAEIEEYRRKKLMEEINFFKLSINIKQYILHIEKDLSSTPENAYVSVDAWLTWVKNYLGKIDPINRDFDLLMNSKDKW
ncbi:MAG: hypothetical protein RLT30_10520 [Gammaproteobacteria bacterium]